jgi:hypothetical protein
MEIKTKTSVTIELTGKEADRLATFLYANGAGHEVDVVNDLWRALKDLPEED